MGFKIGDRVTINPKSRHYSDQGKNKRGDDIIFKVTNDSQYSSNDYTYYCKHLDGYTGNSYRESDLIAVDLYGDLESSLFNVEKI